MCGENASSNAAVPVEGSNDFMTPTATPKKHVRPLQSSLPIFYAQPLPILTLTPIYPIPSVKPAPNDIDLVAVLRPGHNLERDLPMSEYTLVSRAMLRRRFGFDVIVAEPESQLYKTYVEFFSRVREDPAARKGLLRVRL